MLKFAALLATLGLSACATHSAEGPVLNPKVGGAQMYPSKTILANLSASGDHDKLIAAVTASGLVDVLNGPGPFTLFAPTDAAFDALPDKGYAGLMTPDNKGRLSHIFDCSMVTGITSLAQLETLVVDHQGSYQLDTIGGCPVTAHLAADGGLILVSDAGAVAHVTTPDINQENGVVHVIDAVLVPR